MSGVVAVVAVAIGTLYLVISSSSDPVDHISLELPVPPEETAPPSSRHGVQNDGPTVTLLPDACLLSIEVDGRLVYRGKPRCKNKPRAVEIPVPRARAARIRTRTDAHYANGGLWVIHDDEFLMPLQPRRYVVGEGYAIFENASTPTMYGTHCVSVTSSSSHYTSWIALHSADRYGPFAMRGVQSLGGEYNERTLIVVDERGERDERSARYRRLVPGTYRFHVDRHGRITLAYDPIDRC